MLVGVRTAAGEFVRFADRGRIVQHRVSIILWFRGDEVSRSAGGKRGATDGLAAESMGRTIIERPWNFDRGLSVPFHASVFCVR